MSDCLLVRVAFKEACCMLGSAKTHEKTDEKGRKIMLNAKKGLSDF